jgi:integrase
MQQAGVGPHAIRRAYNLLASIMGAAVDEGLVTESPCRRISLPATPVQQPHWFTPAQVAAIREHLPWRHSIAVELMVWTGLRWGEMAGLRIMDVDWLRRRIKVVGSATQDGARKDYPKSAKSRREVPVPPHVMDLLAPLVRNRAGDARMFTSTRAGSPPWSAANWRKTWAAAVAAAGAPDYPPHALRHTAASWLVQSGVELYDVQALLGHESYATTARYSHLKPGEHAAVEDAWDRLAAQQRRTVALAAGEIVPPHAQQP